MNKKLPDFAIETKPLLHGWNSYVLPLDVPEECFGVFRPMIKLWRSKFNNKNTGAIALPTWRSFSFQEFKGWHKLVCLSEVDEKNCIPKLRIVPTGVVTILKTDHTGHTLDKMVNVATKSEISDHFGKLMKGPYIGLTAGSQPIGNGKTQWFESLELPLTLNGSKTEQFIHAICVGHEKS